MFGWLFGTTHEDFEVRRLTIEYPSGEEREVLTHRDNTDEWYENEEHTVTRDETYIYHEPGFFGRLFGRS